MRCASVLTATLTATLAATLHHHHPPPPPSPPPPSPPPPHRHHRTATATAATATATALTATATAARCVFRATCGEAVAPPSELEAALQANSAAAAPTLRVDLSRFDAGGDAAAAAASSAAEAVRSLLDELTGVPVVLLRLTLPEAPADGAQPPIDPAVLRRAHPGLERAASRFRDSCPELLDRSKTRRRECTNFC